jgi:hypothetical protein
MIPVPAGKLAGKLAAPHIPARDRMVNARPADPMPGINVSPSGIRLSRGTPHGYA